MKKAEIKKGLSNDYASLEALNMIGSNLLFSSGKNKKILVTSCMSGDGKSYVSLHLAMSLAKRGLNVILVDGDLRKSSMKIRYKVVFEGDGVGLANYLAGFCTSVDEIVYQTNIKGLTLLPVGRIVTNPVPLLVGQSFEKLLDQLGKEYDVVIVDAPPIGLVVDATEMARSCDGAVIVVSSGKTSRKSLVQVKNQLEVAGCKIYGCILNWVNFYSMREKNYGYYY